MVGKRPQTMNRQKDESRLKYADSLRVESNFACFLKILRKTLRN